jgi:hypothetical protein
VSRAAGLPEGIPGLDMAAGDVNNDGWPDIFLVSSVVNVLLINDSRGRIQRQNVPANHRIVLTTEP